MSHDRTVIVTGAGSARGIGREACLRLAAAGWSVAALDLDEGAVQETAELAARANGGQAVGLGCDVTNSAHVDAAVSVVERDLPPIAALVNNAGITAPTRFLDINEDSIASPPKLAMSIISTPVVPSQYRTSTLGILLMPSF
jgi:2-hydroxycyclohexanecarboxyl-CoA dehydrogenase